MTSTEDKFVIHPEVYKVARVHWRDAATFTGWHSLDEISDIAKEKAPLMQTLGWLIFKSDEFVLLAQSVGYKSAADICKIPIPYIEDMWIQENEDSKDGEVLYHVSG